LIICVTNKNLLGGVKLTAKKKIPKEEYPNLYRAYRDLADELSNTLFERNKRILMARAYMDRYSFFGFVWASGVRHLLLPDYMQDESGWHRFWRETKEYFKEVCF